MLAENQKYVVFKVFLPCKIILNLQEVQNLFLKALKSDKTANIESVVPSKTCYDSLIFRKI